MKIFSRFGVAVMLAIALLCPFAAQAKPQQASAQQVRQLLKVRGTAKLMHTMMKQMVTQMSSVMKQSLPCVPESYWQGMGSTAALKELTNRLIPIYQKHFTSQDVAGLLTFYRTPLGQKVIHEMPSVVHEAMKTGRQWGRHRGMQMVGTLRKNGTLDAQGECPASHSGK